LGSSAAWVGGVADIELMALARIYVGQQDGALRTAVKDRPGRQAEK
jgi:hypothetical protein